MGRNKNLTASEPSEKEEARLEKEYDEMIRAASHYPQAPTVQGQQQHDSALTDDSTITTEDERATIRLSSARRDAEQSENPVSEIDLGSLSAADQVLIKTRRSLYVFTIIEPETIAGRLRGGILGDRVVDAYLLPSWVEGGDSTITHKCIRAGVKFTFVIEAGKGFQRLTTSSVNGLLHRKDARPTTRLKSPVRVTLEQVSD